MRVVTRGSGTSAPAEVERLSRRVLHPLCGLNTRIGFSLRSRSEPRFAVAGAELTGVHRLLGQEQAGSYHIGGVGLRRSEALVRAIGETVERYCQLVSVAGGTVRTRLGTTDEARTWGGPVLDPAALSLFTEEQYRQPEFPFDPLGPDSVFGWADMTETATGQTWQVPAQLAFVGYSPHRGHGEPWLLPAVTTGTATHRTWPAAYRGSLLELIQIDTAMGHWYGNSTAPRIEAAKRLAPLSRIMDRHVPPALDVRFHYLPTPDLPAHTVAAVIRQPGHRRPTTVVGLGCETRLVEACYKALLESIGVLQLAKIGMSRAVLEGTSSERREEDTIFDLDSNVGYYADSGGEDLIAEKFRDTRVADSDLPGDTLGSHDDINEALRAGLLDAGARLFERDLTTVDSRGLGMVTARVWSPDLLALAMPSAPTLAHPRFAAHGGAAHRRPHPYP